MPQGWASCYVEGQKGLAGSWVASSGGTRSLHGPSAPCSLCCVLGAGRSSSLSQPLPPPEGRMEGLLGPTWLPARWLWEPQEQSSATSEWPGATGALLKESRRVLAT